MALAVVGIVMLSMWVYSGGIWPPMVVIESESMMHSKDSQIGVIDTGDLTLVKKIGSKSDIITYVEGRPSYTVSFEEAGQTTMKEETFKGAHPGIMTYGDYGEVIIYRKNGDTRETPVIHRAMAWFEPNATVECISKLPMGAVAGGDFPDIKNSAHPKGLKCVILVQIKNVGYKKDTLVIHVSKLVQDGVMLSGKPLHGFLTHGDHNGAGSGSFQCDQETHTLNGKYFAPNDVDWVVGKAVGELPWFGALKLVASKTVDSDRIPPSSWNGLIGTIVLIIVVPFALDVAAAQYSKRKAKKKGNKDDEEKDEDEDPEEGDAEEEEEETSDEKDSEDEKEKPSKKTSEDSEELVDINDEYGDEFEEMASNKPKPPSKKN
jgi:signal peptidase